MNSKDQLKHSLKIRYGIPPNEITDEVVQKIIDYLNKYGGLSPSPELLSKAVRNFCPGAGTYKYGGMDNSDINALLLRAQKK